MSNIENLWLLQQHYNKLAEIEKNLKEPSTLDKIKKLGVVLKNTEERLDNLHSRIKNKEKTLRKNELTLKELEYKLKEIEKKLYEENIADINQLSLLDKERERLKSDIENLEIELLETMELIEHLKKEYEDLQNNFKEYKIEYTKLVKEHKTFMYEHEKKARIEKKEIEKISSNIDADLLRKFNSLIETKKIAVVEVIDNMCSGCHMILPSIILDKLKRNDDIILCENCHRILYLP